jgi:hypothetical protein
LRCLAGFVVSMRLMAWMMTIVGFCGFVTIVCEIVVVCVDKKEINCFDGEDERVMRSSF